MERPMEWDAENGNGYEVREWKTEGAYKVIGK